MPMRGKLANFTAKVDGLHAACRGTILQNRGLTSFGVRLYSSGRKASVVQGWARQDSPTPPPGEGKGLGTHVAGRP